MMEDDMTRLRRLCWGVSESAGVPGNTPITSPPNVLAIKQVQTRLAGVKQEPPLSDQLRQLIDDSGQSRYAICKATGTDQASMSRFMAGKGWLSSQSIDRIGEYLGFRIVRVNPDAKGR